MAAQYPDFEIDNRIPEFLERLYRATDDPDATEEYISLFTGDASFKCGQLSLQGTDGLKIPYIQSKHCSNY